MWLGWANVAEQNKQNMLLEWCWKLNKVTKCAATTLLFLRCDIVAPPAEYVYVTVQSKSVASKK